MSSASVALKTSIRTMHIYNTTYFKRGKCLNQKIKLKSFIVFFYRSCSFLCVQKKKSSFCAAHAYAGVVRRMFVAERIIGSLSDPRTRVQHLQYDIFKRRKMFNSWHADSHLLSCSFFVCTKSLLCRSCVRGRVLWGWWCTASSTHHSRVGDNYDN